MRPPARGSLSWSLACIAGGRGACMWVRAHSYGDAGARHSVRAQGAGRGAANAHETGGCRGHHAEGVRRAWQVRERSACVRLKICRSKIKSDGRHLEGLDRIYAVVGLLAPPLSKPLHWVGAVYWEIYILNATL